MASYYPYIQIVLSVILVGLVLLQQSDASVGAAFGGDSLSGSSHTRRGPEKVIFITTIVVAVLFVASTIFFR